MRYVLIARRKNSDLACVFDTETGVAQVTTMLAWKYKFNNHVGVSREFLESETRKLYEEALAADPWHVETITAAVVGASVFAWGSLTLVKLRALRQAIYPTALSARGV